MRKFQLKVRLMTHDQVTCVRSHHEAKELREKSGGQLNYLRDIMIIQASTYHMQPTSDTAVISRNNQK
jgi:hypothetical protein